LSEVKSWFTKNRCVLRRDVSRHLQQTTPSLFVAIYNYRNRQEIKMNNTTPKSTRFVTTIRWLARIIGILSAAVFLIFFVADCVKKGTIAVDSDRIVMTVFLLVTFICLVIAWKWEGIGGIIALLGLIGFIISAPESLPRPAVIFMAVMYGLPALLFIFCWWQTRKPIASQVAQP
jgi:hypothetical protein